jgi:hypothetical protein
MTTDDHFFDYLFTRRKPVFDGSQVALLPVVLTDDSGTIVLTDDTGTVILTPEFVPTGYPGSIPAIELREDGGLELREGGDKEFRETTTPVVQVVIGQLYRWI